MNKDVIYWLKELEDYIKNINKIIIPNIKKPKKIWFNNHHYYKYEKINYYIIYDNIIQFFTNRGKDTLSHIFILDNKNRHLTYRCNYSNSSGKIYTKNEYKKLRIWDEWLLKEANDHIDIFMYFIDRTVDIEKYGEIDTIKNDILKHIRRYKIKKILL